MQNDVQSLRGGWIQIGGRRIELLHVRGRDCVPVEGVAQAARARLQYYHQYLNLEPLAETRPRRPAAFESKTKNWPARLNAPTPNSLSSSPYLHPHDKY